MEVIMKSFHIGKKTISRNHPCYIIAEIGGNHNGKEALAVKLVEEAVKSGVDAVKFSRFDTERFMTRSNEPGYLSQNSGRNGSNMADSYKNLGVSGEMLSRIANLCKRHNVDFLSTPFDEESVDLVVKIGVPAIKIASGDLTADPFLKYVAQQKLPVILSTGMSNIEEVRYAVSLLLDNGCPELSLLHCVSSFPAEPDALNLKVVRSLAREFEVPVGFSDHTAGMEAAPIAVAAGACIIEKHFTLDRELPGPDHAFSLDPYGMTQLIKAIRQVEVMLGVEKKAPSEAELEYRKFGRRSIAARVAIEPGSVITEAMLTLKRPGTGIAPRDLYKVLGKKAKVRVSEGEMLSWDKIG
jgi:N,N'-diacetyllegionaminate synthase